MSDVPADSDYSAPQSGPISIVVPVATVPPSPPPSPPVNPVPPVDLAALAAAQRANPQITPYPQDPPSVDGPLLTRSVFDKGA